MESPVNTQRILIIGTYPLHPAMHGGQKRTEAIIERYRRNGHAVKYISISTPGNYPRYTKDDLKVSDEAMQVANSAPSTTFTELLVCSESRKNERLIEHIKGIVEDFKPTIVEYEQGYPYALTEGIESLIGIENLPIIYSSHNVEWSMKKEIALSEGLSQSQIQQYIDEIKRIELTLIRRADATITVSEADRQVYVSQNHASDTPIIVAPNGINPLHPTSDSLQHWQEYFHKSHITKTAVFVASAHPPNLHGFRTLIDGVGFLPYDYRIVVAGGLADMLKNMVKRTADIQLATLRNRVILLGRLPEDKLQGLIMQADAILLPILEGGGSNLKTAEALASGRPVVATSHAFRSYDDLRDLEGIYIADTPEDYQQQVVLAMRQESRGRAIRSQEAFSRVYWENALAPLDKLFERNIHDKS